MSGPDDRKAFEDMIYKKAMPHSRIAEISIKRGPYGFYEIPEVEQRWQGWCAALEWERSRKRPKTTKSAPQPERPRGVD